MNTGADNAKTDDELENLVNTWEHEINLLKKITQLIEEITQKQSMKKTDMENGTITASDDGTKIKVGTTVRDNEGHLGTVTEVDDRFGPEDPTLKIKFEINGMPLHRQMDYSRLASEGYSIVNDQ